MTSIDRREVSNADATAEWPPGPTDLAPLLATLATETVRPLVTALIAICALIIAVDWMVRDARTAMLLSLATFGYGSALLYVHEAQRRAAATPRKAHATISGVIMILLTLIFARCILSPAPAQQNAGLAMVMIVSGFVILDLRWLLTTLTFAIVGWTSIRLISPSAPDAATAILFLSSIPLSLAAQLLRLRLLRREETWRQATQAARENAERAMRALRESEERTRSVIEASLDAVISADEEGTITDWNNRATSIFGWTREEAIGRTVASLIVPPHLRTAHEQGLRNFAATGRGVILDQRIELEVMHRDGHHFLAEIAISMARKRNRQIFSAFIRDITQRHAMEAAMREETQISTSLARVGYELIVSLSTTGLLRRLCELTAEVLDCEISDTFLFDRDSDFYLPVESHGHSHEEWVAIQSLELPVTASPETFARLSQETVIAVYPDSDDFPHPWVLERYGIRAALLIALRRGPDLIGIQTAAHRRDGESFSPAQLRLARDLAQIASLALDNARLFEEADRSSRIKSEFVATMSHELRTPLNVILGYNELLLDGTFSPLTDQQSEMLQRSNRSALQLRELITATLDMSRLEAGRMDLDLEEVDLAELARDIDTETQPFRSDRPEIELRWQIASDLPTISTDRSKLKVTLKNLVTNAVKFTDQGSVTVAIDRGAGGGVEIRVIDTGIGIPPEAIQTVFEPFRQADGSSTRRHGGVGLGLYIVRRLLEMLGGSIEVSSEVGKGTFFHIHLEDRWPADNHDSDEEPQPVEEPPVLRAAERVALAAR